MTASLSKGDKVHIGDAMTLTVLYVEGNVVQLGVEWSQSSSADSGLLYEQTDKNRPDWWKWN